MRRLAIARLALVVVTLSASGARADEIRLKDGSKIIGTIVGFENDSFRVETSYGFALIKKDKVADINITATKKDSESKSRSSSPATATSGQPNLAVAPAPSSTARDSALTPNVAPEPNASASVHSLAGVKSDPAAAKTKSGVAETIATPVPSPPAVPAPEPVVIRDEIRGNLYVNFTYGFEMYKPPSWDLIPGARKALPDAVAALGTHDQTTLLVIGREHANDSLDAHAAGTEKTLGNIYENYRLISNKHLMIAGFPAIEQRSRGTADGRDWSVILLTFVKGNDAFTLLGMTWADSDLIQVQENVIAKTVNSLEFIQK